MLLTAKIAKKGREARKNVLDSVAAGDTPGRLAQKRLASTSVGQRPFFASFAAVLRDLCG
jgi:hypothetical protein